MEFGTARPPRYEATFNLPTSLRFAQNDTLSELRGAFDALAQANCAETRGSDREQKAEPIWTCHHGAGE